jgi:hypothetical protein
MHYLYLISLSPLFGERIPITEFIFHWLYHNQAFDLWTREHAICSYLIIFRLRSRLHLGLFIQEKQSLNYMEINSRWRKLISAFGFGETSETRIQSQALRILKVHNAFSWIEFLIKYKYRANRKEGSVICNMGWSSSPSLWHTRGLWGNIKTGLWPLKVRVSVTWNSN